MDPHYTTVKTEDIILPSVLKVGLSFLLMMKEALSMAILLGVLLSDERMGLPPVMVVEENSWAWSRCRDRGEELT